MIHTDTTPYPQHYKNLSHIRMVDDLSQLEITFTADYRQLSFIQMKCEVLRILEGIVS